MMSEFDGVLLHFLRFFGVKSKLSVTYYGHRWERVCIILYKASKAKFNTNFYFNFIFFLGLSIMSKPDKFIKNDQLFGIFPNILSN